MSFSAAVVMTAAVAIVVPLLAQAPTFRTDADVVRVYATVTDESGAIVQDLSPDDFGVYEDGRLRPLALMNADPQPFSAVVMLDLSQSMTAFRALLTDGASTFTSRFLPRDRARMGSFGGPTVFLEPGAFSGDRRELGQAVDIQLARARGGGSPIWQSVDYGLDALRSEPFRRVVILFSDGYNNRTLELHDEYGALLAKPPSFGRIKQRARVDDVMAYALGFVTRSTTTSRWGETWTDIPPDPALKDLARDSGGGYVEVNALSDFNGIFSRIADELHGQYLLGFVPAAHDGKTHDIAVKVRRPGLTVRARAVYVAETAR